MEYSPLFVTLMGMGTVFFGLVCIIFLTQFMGKVMGRAAAKPVPAPAAAASAVSSQGVQLEIIAAITAVLSEEVGTSASNIVSIKKF